MWVLHKSHNKAPPSALQAYGSLASYGIAAGLIASLAISAIIMLTEGISMLPSGFFYSVLASASFPAYPVTGIALVFGLHLLAGSLIGFALSSLFFAAMTIKPRLFGAGPRSYGAPTIRYAPVWGIAAGFAAWACLFLPVTFGLVVPLLSSGKVDSLVTVHSRTGELVTLSKNDIINQVIVMSFALHLFFGMTIAILIRSMYQARVRKAMARANRSEPVPEF